MVEAILLDRDGVIVEPVPDPRLGTHESPLHAGEVRLIPGAADALAELHRRGQKLIVVSNQPAAAKGTVPMSELEGVHRRTVELLAQVGVRIDHWEYCFHHPQGVVEALTGPCDCRKPAPGLIRRGLEWGEVAAARAWMVGDADTDVVAGRRAGTRTALVAHPLTGHRRRGSSGEPPDLTVADLSQFVKWLVSAGELAYSSVPKTPGALELKNKEGC